MNEFLVKIDFRDKNMRKVDEKTYTFKEYASLIKFELMRILMDVEDAFYRMQDGHSREEWDKETIEAFQKIRHKLLDEANAIERLPRNLYYGNMPCFSESAGEMIGRMVEQTLKDKK